MRQLTLLFLIVFTAYQCNSQSLEASRYIREELVKQQEDLLKQVQAIQKRIDAIDQKVEYENNTNYKTQYLTKSTHYTPENTYSNSIPVTTTKSKKYTKKKYQKGARGGCYYINTNGNKTYVDRSLCN